MRTILLLLALAMPITVSDAGLLLDPFFRVAELIASTAKWQEVTETDTVEAASASIAFPQYVDFEEARQGVIEVPLIVLSDPWDLMLELFGAQDEQGRVDHGQILWQLFLKTEDGWQDDPNEALRVFYQTEGVLLAQMAALSGRQKEDTSWHITLKPFQQAFAPRQVPISNLQCVVRDGDEDQKPQSVTTGAFVLDWSRS